MKLFKFFEKASTMLTQPLVKPVGSASSRTLQPKTQHRLRVINTKILMEV